MTWSYDETNLGTDTALGRRNVVRFLVQDTDTADQLVQNEEIDFTLSESNNDVYNAAARVCESISARFSRYGDTVIDETGIGVDYNKVAKSYAERARKFRETAKRSGAGIGTPVAGGISRSAMETAYEDTDRVDPAFKHRQFSNPPFGNDDDERYRD